MGFGLPDLEAMGAEVKLLLDKIEDRLLALVREGAHSTTPLDDIINGLSLLASEIRPEYRQLQELLDRRDMEFDSKAELEALQKRALWLYRKSQLERLFYSKLRLERSLRDLLYRQILETYEELLTLEDGERALRKLPDDVLGEELLKNETGS